MEKRGEYLNNSELIKDIADKNVDIDRYVELVLSNTDIRSTVVDNILNNPSIMVYYHCYNIISKASEKEPSLFYEYWNDFALLLNHRNSYHRDIGLTIIANLTKVDNENLFLFIYDTYIELFNDIKFMTAECFVKNLKKVVVYKPEYEESLVTLLLDVDNRCSYTVKQKELLKSIIIEFFDLVYEKTLYQEKILSFVNDQVGSISPKTRKIAQNFLKKYDGN